jgi:CrcB protein
MYKKGIAVGLGGFAGALLRYGISEWIPAVNGFPWGILMINWTGCLFLGWFLTAAGRQFQIPPHVTLAIGTGFVGAYTTFSTFAVDTVHLIQDGHMGKALLYILSSVIVGLLLAFAGVRLGYLGAAKSKSEGKVV